MPKTLGEGVRLAGRLAHELGGVAREIAIRLDAPLTAKSVANAKQRVVAARHRAMLKAALDVAELAEDPDSSVWDDKLGS